MRDGLAQGALGLDKIKMWKLKCFKFCLWRSFDLERVMDRKENRRKR